MGDMAEEFREHDDYKKKRRAKIEPTRIAYAEKKLSEFNIERVDDHIVINLKDGVVLFYPFTGWFQGYKPLGKIKGRGIEKLTHILHNRHINT